MKTHATTARRFGISVLFTALALGCAARVHAGVPTVTKVDAPFVTGARTFNGGSVYLTVLFSESVIVSGGSPTLQLETAGGQFTHSNTEATFVGGSPGPSLVFEYKIRLGDYSTDLDYAFFGLRLNGSTIKSLSTSQNFDPLTGMPLPGSPSSLSGTEDIRIVTQFLSLTTVGTVDEGSLVTWKVTRTGILTENLRVSLSSSSTAVATVDSSVTLAPNVSEASFSVVGVGQGVATITVSANAYSPESAGITVRKATLVLALAGQTPIDEGKAVDWFVTRSGSTLSSLTVSLTSSVPTVADVNAVVLIAVGKDQSTFTVTGLNGGTSLITATAPNYDSASKQMKVEIVPKTITFTGNNTVDEGKSISWQISRSGPTAASLTVTLGSSSEAGATVDGTVVIQAGEQSASFNVYGIDGPRVVTISGTASGFTTATKSINVANVDPVIQVSPPPGGLVCDTLTFSYSARDAGNDPVLATWVFGDGTTVRNVGPAPDDFVTHQYLTDGAYTVLFTASDGDGGIYTESFEITIDPAYTLAVSVLPVGHAGLAGVGTGTFTVSPTPTACGTFKPGQVVTITPNAASGSFFYEWGGDLMYEEQAVIRTLTLTMDQDRIITLLFSREYSPGEGVGDLDGDGLSDQWELRYQLDPKDVADPNGGAGNPDGDLLPAQPGYTYANPPANLEKGAFLPADSDPFVNRLEFRGFDGILNTPDDPGTNPSNADSDGDGLTDGWEYFFWGNAVNDTNVVGYAYDSASVTGTVTISNQAVQDTLNPRASGNSGADTDNDGLTNLEEFGLGTNPIHFDTDGDKMPDGWEVLYGLNPLKADDFDDNADDDWMARDGSNNLHHAVYEAAGYDPRTAWNDTFRWLDRNLRAQTNTVAFTTLDEFLVARYYVEQGIVASVPPSDWDDYTTNPNTPDTDGDGIADGWELYVGTRPVGPQSAVHASQDGDSDGLTDLQEFRCAEVAETSGGTFPVVQPTWLNKLWPTDPNDPDTDGDQLPDGVQTINDKAMGESVMFVYSGAGGWNGSCFVGGGMNPTSADTDGDFLPDFWEAEFASVMDGTTRDSVGDQFDYDGDGLENYQEYLVNAVYHFQYDEFIPPSWTPGGGLGEYDPWDFFEGNPYEWDWHFYAWGTCAAEYHYILGQPRGDGAVRYAGTHPDRSDTDWDDMDDFYELYHGLNPLYGTLDIVHGPNTLATVPVQLDIRETPWLIGSQFADPDQDGLVNDKESLQPTHSRPQYYHTDPTPLWITDQSYQLSWVNLYYSLGTMEWYWSSLDTERPCNALAPFYMFSFEVNEGYDTDNDNIADGPELVGSESPGATDPLDMESPLRRRALYLPGDAAARTRGQYFYGATALESWTVEAWVKAETAAPGVTQVLVERPFELPANNPAGAPEGTIRLNFRVGLDGAGRPFAEYDGSGYDPGTVNPKVVAPTPIGNNEWSHIAAVYDGALKRLILYVNGIQVAFIPSTLIPANGWYQGNPGWAFDGPVVVGAKDLNPSGYVGSSSPFYPDGVLAPNEPQLSQFFKGWIDEIRIWDGARSIQQIRNEMNARMMRSRVAEAAAGTAYPRLLYFFSFDDMADPDHQPVAPEGFDLLNGFPADGSYPHIPWWGTAPDRSTVYNEYRYVPWIENLVAHLPTVPPADSTITNDVPNASNPYGVFHEEFNDGSTHPDIEGMFADLLPLRGAEGDADVVLWDGARGTDPIDTDGDGMDDDWEILYGLDPRDSSGENGKWGDRDQDGLDNWAEYSAGTNPNVYDSDADGIGDYDSPAGDSGFTNGQVYDDGDGMASAWEAQYGLDPRTHDGSDDNDSDGWSNFAEFMGATAPNIGGAYPEPTVNFTIRYNGINQNGNIIAHFYTKSAMDGEPDAIFEPTGAGLVGILGEVIGLAGNPTLAGTLGHADIYPGSLMITVGGIGFTDNGQGTLIGTQPGSNGTIDYETGAWTLFFSSVPTPGAQIRANYAYLDKTLVTFPLRGSLSNAAIGHLREGPNWVFGFIDVDNNRCWSGGEPAGLAEYQPVNVGWGKVDIEIGLTDKMLGITDLVPGYGRFEWPEVPGQETYLLRIRRETSGSSGDSPLVIERTIYGRHPEEAAGEIMWFHEGDILHAGYLLGLPPGNSAGPSYEWKIGDAIDAPRGTIQFQWPEPPGPPQLVSPNGSQASSARIPFRWKSDATSTGFRMQIAPLSPNNTPIMDEVFRAPFRRPNGGYQYEYLAPVWGGDIDFDNGAYWWRVQRLDPLHDGSDGKWVSSWAQFTLDVDSEIAGPYGISGTLYYYGGVTNASVSEFLALGNGATSRFTGQLDETPVVPGTLIVESIDMPAGTVLATLTDNGGGVLVGANGQSGIIDYETGAWALNFNGAPPPATAEVVADYEHFANRFVVQAFASSGFSGEAAAQTTLWAPGPYEVKGLSPGTYYVRGFIDQNGNGAPDDFETQGFVPDLLSTTPSFFAVRAFAIVSAGGSYANADMTIRDRDTDDDNMPDAVEYDLYGNLASYPAGAITIDVAPNTATWRMTAFPDAYRGAVSGVGDLQDLAPRGTYTVAYDPLAGYATPPAQTRSVTVGQTAAFTGVYVRQVGTLRIDVTPDAGTWTITSYPADYSGPTAGVGDVQVGSAGIGSYTVAYGSLPGYVKPATQTQQLQTGQTTTFSGVYLRPSGTLRIDVAPDTGTWTITVYPTDYSGPKSGTGDLQVTATAGSYTVAYGELAGYLTPAAQTQSVQVNQTTTFTGTYAALVNLVRPANGGVLESFTSQYSASLGQASKLTDGVKASVSGAWGSKSNPGPQQFVYSFQGGKTATIDHVVVYNYSTSANFLARYPQYLYLSQYSRDVEIQVSTDGTTFTPAGTVRLAAHLRAQKFSLGGVAAKKVKLVVKNGYGTALWTLAEFEAYGTLP